MSGSPALGRPQGASRPAPTAGLHVGLVCPYSFDTPGGVQSHVRGLAGYLREEGHFPHILAPGEATPGDIAGEFTSAGASVPVRYNGSVARVNFGPLSAARVARWLRGGAFDLVHLHEPITPSISVLALWAADVPVVATFHTATPRSRSMQMAGGAMRATVEKIDAGIAVSESARQVVVQHLGRDALVIPNGFCHHFFASGVAASNGRWRAGPRPRLTFVGRTDEPRKGLDVLLSALPEIRGRHPELEVVVVGVGARQLPPGCRRLGVVTDAEKAQLLASSDVFVAPHLARESFGIVLLEAMASGAAVVASDLAPFTDLLAGDRAPEALGTTFPVGDASALAAAVLRVLDFRDETQIAAARRISRRYDWSRVGAAVTEVYRATTEQAGPATAAALGR